MASKKKYTVLDLFCGCGGLSKGFENTGRVKLVGAIDFDKAACETYKLNFPKTNVICGDINNISVESTSFKDIDIIIGGPPCQGVLHSKYINNGQVLTSTISSTLQRIKDWILK